MVFETTTDAHEGAQAVKDLFFRQAKLEAHRTNRYGIFTIVNARQSELDVFPMAVSGDQVEVKTTALGAQVRSVIIGFRRIDAVCNFLCSSDCQWQPPFFNDESAGSGMLIGISLESGSKLLCRSVNIQMIGIH